MDGSALHMADASLCVSSTGHDRSLSSRNRNSKSKPLSAPLKSMAIFTPQGLADRSRDSIATRSRSGSARLPWLDGSRGSQLAAVTSRLPHIPGEYVNETSVEQLSSEPAWQAAAKLDQLPTLHPPEASTEQQTTKRHGEGPQTDEKPSRPQLQPLRIPPLDPTVIDFGATRPAVPLVSLMRRAMRSDESFDSGAVSERIKSRHRSYSEGSFQPPRNPASPTLAIQDEPQPTKSSTQSMQPLPVTLDKSIQNLELLMNDAVNLAKDAAAHHQANEASGIVEETAKAFHNAFQVRENQEMAVPRGVQPIRMSFSYTSSSSQYSSDRTSSSRSSEEDETVLASVSPAKRPVVSGAASRRPSIACAISPDRETSKGVKAVWDEGPPDPVVIDWAYENAAPGKRRAWCAPEEARIPYRKTFGTGIDPKILRGTVTASDQVNLRKPMASPSKEKVHNYVKQQGQVPIPPRRSYLKAGNQTDGQVAQSPGSASYDYPSPTERGYERSPTSGGGKGPNWSRDKYDDKDYISRDALKRKHHVELGESQRFSVHHHRRQPIARNWSNIRKRFTAFVACVNTALIGMLIGIYAGEVPAIQYALTDTDHYVILGNVTLYLGMAITTFVCWPLPLLHGRKPYNLAALALALPLQFPQAVITMGQRDPNNTGFRTGLLLCRGLSGLALGLLHINCKPTLLDLFGASLQSSHPHGEVVIVDDLRRHGGGIGLWLGFWSFCFIGSISIGFLVGAGIISGLNVSWGFYVGVILIAVVLLLNVITPETRRAPHRRTLHEVELPNMNVSRRVARGEIKMHVDGDGPKWWFEECFAGLYLQWKMVDQSGFFIMAMYLGWVYGEIVLIIVLLGNLLSANYQWRPEYIGLGVLSIAIGAFLALPDTKANIFSRSRKTPPRTDSMTFQPRLTWTSHLVRRAAFMIVLPIAGLAYTLASSGRQVHFIVPIIFAGFIGYFSNLAIAECHGLIMETYDTSDLQPGVNSRHRLQSLPTSTRRRRTTYTSYPRVCAGLFTSHTLGFLFAATATGVGGAVTRRIGAQKATGITAGVLLGFTVLLTLCLWRYKSIQVIPNELFGSLKRESTTSVDSEDWRAVIIGNPSGKVRRMSLLELGSLSRWTEIRRLNRLLNRTTTQGLNEGWR